MHSSLSREHMNLQLTCSQRQWLHSSVGYSVAPLSRGHGFKPRWSPEFFSGFFTQLHIIAFITARINLHLIHMINFRYITCSWLYVQFKVTRINYLTEKETNWFLPAACAYRFPKKNWKQTWWSNDKTINVNVSQINYCLSLLLRQITDLLATDKSRYFAQPCPIIMNWWTRHSVRSSASLTRDEDSWRPSLLHSVFQT